MCILEIWRALITNASYEGTKKVENHCLADSTVVHHHCVFHKHTAGRLQQRFQNVTHCTYVRQDFT